MGLNSGRTSQDVQRLTQEVDRARRQIDRIIAELADARDRIPDPDEIRRSLSPAPPDQRRDLANSCIALQLALGDTSRWAHEVAERTQAWHASPGADAA